MPERTRPKSGASGPTLVGQVGRFQVDVLEGDGTVKMGIGTLNLSTE